MLNSNTWRAGVVAAALVVWPVLATAQTDPQSGSSSQGTSATSGQQQTQQSTTGQQNQSGTQGQADQSSGQGFGQGQGQADSVRQEALSQLTAARQSLAEMTKLPAAAHLEGQARSEINQLITDFNNLITSTGPEWRQAYDRVQSDLRGTIGADPNQPADSAVGTSGAARVSLDPSLAAKLNEVRQHVNQFGQIVGVQPGQSAVASQSSNNNASTGMGNTGSNAGTQSSASSNPQSTTSSSSSSTTGTSGSSTGTTVGTSGTSSAGVNSDALRSIDQINAILSRVLAQPSMSPNQDSVTVSKQDLQQIQQYLNQLRQSVGGSGR